ncbi:hypothetical protein LINPERHAP1_LOCUS22029, partial [Linum perenne]
VCSVSRKERGNQEKLREGREVLKLNVYSYTVRGTEVVLK